MDKSVRGDTKTILPESGIKLPVEHSHELTGSKYLENYYLKCLITQCDQLDISAIDEAHSDDHKSVPLRISDVFTTLFLKNIERLPDQSVADVIRKERETPDALAKSEHKERVPVQAIEAAGAVNRLVILGRPGGGKSTLVSHIAGQLARLRKDDAVTEKALPGWTSDHKPLPVRIIMRQFAAQMPDDGRQVSERIVWKFIEHQLEEMGCGQFFPALQHTLDEDGGVIFFDGLDEVSEADKARKRIIMVKAIQEFVASLTKCRIIITCREYAYSKDDAWRLPEFVFPVVELDLFRAEQIKAFTRTWYLKTGPRKGWTEKRCLTEAENLYQAVVSWDHLRELGQYPLLLTLMAQVHGRDGSLPEDRADLYERAVNLLLTHWENRIEIDGNGSRTVKPGRVMQLDVRAEVLRNALKRVALAAIVREDLRLELDNGLECGLDRAEEVLTYIQHRAGLLQDNGAGTFAFPHRTFQEYLAATGIMVRDDCEEFLCECIQRDLAWWQEVFLLAAGSRRKTPKIIYEMLDTLLPDDADNDTIDAATASYAQLAARAMSETKFIELVIDKNKIKSGKYAKINKRVQN